MLASPEHTGQVLANRAQTGGDLTVGINSDMLYPEYQQQHMRELLNLNGVPNEYVTVDSHHGHDAFLIHFDEVGEPISRFLDRVERNG